MIFHWIRIIYEEKYLISNIFKPYFSHFILDIIYYLKVWHTNRHTHTQGSLKCLLHTHTQIIHLAFIIKRGGNGCLSSHSHLRHTHTSHSLKKRKKYYLLWCWKIKLASTFSFDLCCVSFFFAAWSCCCCFPMLSDSLLIQHHFSPCLFIGSKKKRILRNVFVAKWIP